MMLNAVKMLQHNLSKIKSFKSWKTNHSFNDSKRRKMKKK